MPQFFLTLKPEEREDKINQLWAAMVHQKRLPLPKGLLDQRTEGVRVVVGDDPVVLRVATKLSPQLKIDRAVNVVGRRATLVAGHTAGLTAEPCELDAGREDHGVERRRRVVMTRETVDDGARLAQDEPLSVVQERDPRADLLGTPQAAEQVIVRVAEVEQEPQRDDRVHAVVDQRQGFGVRLDEAGEGRLRQPGVRARGHHLPGDVEPQDPVTTLGQGR